MDKYISAEKLLNEFLTYPSLWVSYQIEGREDKDIEKIVADVLRQAKETIIREINDQEAADVRENVRGRWEDCSNGWMCSECYHSQIHETNFCPHCGADTRSTSTASDTKGGWDGEYYLEDC